LLGFVSLRLQQVYFNSTPFGGKNIILLGDFSQLQPVIDTPLYSKRELVDNYEIHGSLAYKTFNKCVILKKSMRATDSSYFDLLKRIRVGELQGQDKLDLQNRFVDKISPEEQLHFAKNATFLFAERASMLLYNE